MCMWVPEYMNKMMPHFISFRAKIITGFIIVLLVFMVGLGSSVLGIIKISTMLKLSNNANHMAKDVYEILNLEKEYIVNKNTEVAEMVSQNLANVLQIANEMSAISKDEKWLTELNGIYDSVVEYRLQFTQIAKNTKEFEDLKAKMKRASSIIFNTDCLISFSLLFE